MKNRMRMRWFGRNWHAHINSSNRRRLTPFWMKCISCGSRIDIGDQGITMPYVDDDKVGTAAYHLDCFLIGVTGQSMNQIH